jgi:hypothetical protein
MKHKAQQLTQRERSEGADLKPKPHQAAIFGLLAKPLHANSLVAISLRVRNKGPLMRGSKPSWE